MRFWEAVLIIAMIHSLRRATLVLAGSCLCSVRTLGAICITPVSAQTRSLGLDISAWQGNMSQTTWNNIHNVEGRDFAFIRSSRGGSTGYYNQSNSDNDPPDEYTFSAL